MYSVLRQMKVLLIWNWMAQFSRENAQKNWAEQRGVEGAGQGGGWGQEKSEGFVRQKWICLGKCHGKLWWYCAAAACIPTPAGRVTRSNVKKNQEHTHIPSCLPPPLHTTFTQLSGELSSENRALPKPNL